MNYRQLFLFCAAAALPQLSATAPAGAADVAAIVSADSGPYAEAYAAFKAALTSPPDFYDASKPDFTPPEDAKVTVAFGARAAALQYPAGARVIYALTPITGRGPAWHEISMLPPPGPALAAYKGLQPGLRRLAVFWSVYPGEKYMQDLRQEGDAAGIEIVSARLKSPDSLPERLRRLMGKMDAFWLMPDPALITPGSLLVLGNFACANSVPFYAPTYALALNGGTAAYAPDFAEAGAAAARTAALLKGGAKVPAVIYPDNIRLKVNDSLIAKCRWPVKHN